jgi:hypothetical protein
VQTARQGCREEKILEPQPHRAKAEPQRQQSAADRKKQPAGKQLLSESRSRGTAYIPRPEFPEDKKQPVPKGKWKRWVIVSAAAAVLGLAALEIPQWLAPHHRSEFVLTAADVDQVATAKARTALRAGHTPPEMARYPKELLQRIADGNESLYTKRLSPPEAAEMRVHVTVSQNGAVRDDEELTPEHPSTQSFPAGRNSPTQFHFTVEQPGPSRQVTCWVKSENSGAAYTRPMGQGESDDLQARAQ